MRFLPLFVSLSLFAGAADAQKPKDSAKPKDAPKSSKEKGAKKQDPKAEEMKAKGFVEVDGIWVQKEHVDDAKKGVFHFDGQAVVKGEYVALSAGAVRHPVTGELVPADMLEQLRDRRFLIGSDGKVVDEKEADSFHSDSDHPWVLTRREYVLVSTLPLAKLESLREHVERGLARVKPVLGAVEPLPTVRPTILIASTQDEFVAFGTGIGDGTSAYGGFLAREDARLGLPNQGQVRPAVALWDESWGPYYLPHAAGLAYAHAVCVSCGEAEIPQWLLHGLAALGSRFESPGTGAWFCQSMAKAGGFQALDAWFKGYQISGNMEPDAISKNLTQAGLLVDFCMQGGDEKATAALQALTEAFRSAKAASVAKAATGLQTALLAAQPAIEKYLQKQLR